LTKPFEAIVPAIAKDAYAHFQFAPAVRLGDQILVSGIIGFDRSMALPADFRHQVENVFDALEAVLEEAGATFQNVAALQSFHVGDLAAQMAEFIEVKTRRLGAPHPAWTAVGVAGLAVAGALGEVSATIYVPTHGA
jgi:enamine deaminase RidA (YjgF/YER057c/UK114 family)